MTLCLASAPPRGAPRSIRRTPKTTRPDGTPEFQETELDSGPQKAIELRCDFCGEEFMLGVETGEEN
ncbi:MAG: hypothetical protein BRD27_02000 [Bacteroidetes bacterium QH_10_64_19]|nr:MAG: hypothetical protein BRD27_02000 [Bacteroidetes bacterium QH_10_64_19]